MNLSKVVPHGRGIFMNKDKWILGYVSHGHWADGSPQIVIIKKKNEFRVVRFYKKRDGTDFEIGKAYN